MVTALGYVFMEWYKVPMIDRRAGLPDFPIFKSKRHYDLYVLATKTCRNWQEYMCVCV